MQGKHERAKQECSTQDAEMELSMADKNWQTDAQWTDCGILQCRKCQSQK